MRRRRVRQGFVSAGRLDLKGRGMPAARARQLLLEEAWNRVAGPAVAPLVALRDVRRGVLTVEIATDDPGWRSTLEELVPELAARVGLQRPELRIRRYRIVGGARGTLPEVSAMAGDETAGRSPAAAREPRAEGSEPPERRLRRVMEAYLARRGGG